MSTEQLEDTLERTIALDVATMSPAMRNRYRAALAQAEQPLGYIREPGLRSLAEGNHTTMYPKQIPAHGYTIPVYAHPPAKREAGENETRWEAQAKQATSVIAMIRAMIGEMFGQIASIESEEATLLRGPEPKHDGEAILEALGRVRDALQTQQAVVLSQIREHVAEAGGYTGDPDATWHLDQALALLDAPSAALEASHE